MTAISSFRPHVEDGEYRTNQIRAWRSWKEVFSRIIYLGDREPELENDQTFFVPTPEWPRIRDLIKVAANADTEYAVLLNADIVVSTRILHVFSLMKTGNIGAAVSKRWTFDPRRPDFTGAKITDHGLDVFVATPKVWQKALRKVPACLRLGHFLWDTWLSGYLNKTLRNGVADFTSQKCVFHPQHNGRNNPYTSEITVNDPYIHMAGMPGRRL